MKIVEPFFTYMGNKLELADWIVPFFPKHKTYVEVFGGTYAIGLNKPKAQIEIYNDYNRGLANLFHIVRTRYDEFSEQLDKCIISEEWYKTFHKDHNTSDELEDAIRFFYVMSLTFRGKFDGGFSYIKSPGFTEILEKKQAIVKAIHERIKNVIVLNKNYVDVIVQNNDAETLLYLDPPYVKTEVYYKSKAGSFKTTDHLQLRDLLYKHKGYFFLSYEDDPMIAELYSDCHIHRKQLTRNTNGVSIHEILVTNYKPTQTLFDNTGYI